MPAAKLGTAAEIEPVSCQPAGVRRIDQRVSEDQACCGRGSALRSDEYEL